MLDILTSYTFKVVFAGTLLLSISSALVGSLNLYKGQSLIGDAIGHSTFPGITLAFILFQSRNPLILLLGACISGGIAYYIIQKIKKNSIIELDASLAIVLSGFFGIGMVFKSYIQGNKSFTGTSQAGLEKYIFGQASYLLESDVIIIATITIICLFLMLAFYKELKLYLFDPEFAQVTGIPSRLVDMVILVLTLLVISAGIKSVGFILISSFLIIPTIIAQQWSHKFGHVLVLACIFSAISTFIGNYLSSSADGLATGPTIIVVSCIIAFFSMLFGKRSFIYHKLRRKKWFIHYLLL